MSGIPRLQQIESRLRYLYTATAGFRVPVDLRFERSAGIPLEQSLSDFEENESDLAMAWEPVDDGPCPLLNLQELVS